MSYNSAEINEFSDIWVFCEQRDGKLMNTDFELVSEGRKLADERGSKLVGILLGGEGIENTAKELGGYGADKVIVCADKNLAVYTTDAYSKVLCDVVMEKKPEVLLIGASNIGRDLGPRVAARLHTGLTADATHLDIDMDRYVQFLKESSTIDLEKVKFKMDDTNLKMTRPAFGGHLMATIICPRFRPCMSTVRPGVMKKAEFDQAKADACEIEMAQFSLTDADLRTKVLEVVKETKKLVDLIGADIVVSVGRGISKDPEKGIKLAEELAEALGGGLSSLIATSSIMGFGSVVSASPAYESITTALVNMDANPLITALISINVIAAITGSSAGGLNIFLSSMGEYLAASGLNMAMLHRVVCIASSGFDAMPHASGMVVCNQIAKTSQKDTYKYVFITCAIMPFCCAILACIIGTLGIV